MPCFSLPNAMRWIVILFVVNVGISAQAAGEPFHLGFEDFAFIEKEDFVHRSGLKSIEDRGLELVEGRFGNGLVATRETRIVEQDEMTGIDLDLTTAVVFNTRHRREQWDVYNEPFLWSAGKTNSSCGAVAFWLKGPVAGNVLFEMAAMAWGRKETDLIGVGADENGRFSAWIVDSRYVRHEITADVSWDENRFNHVAFSWDRANGLTLHINGETVASSHGRDAWWRAPLPGLFHLPAPKAVYDEFYLFDHALDSSDVNGLMTENRIPDRADERSRTPEERDRLSSALGSLHGLHLPLVRPHTGNAALSFREVTPLRAGDGHVPGRFCFDGRYELAWPHPVATFTIIPGDADFQAEKLVVEMPPDEPFNYVTIEGNLSGMPLVYSDARQKSDGFTGRSFLSIPQDDRFFFGREIERGTHPVFTLPFLKGRGAPGEFEGDVLLPLTGDTRIHEVGVFDVADTTLTLSDDDITLNIAGRKDEGDIPRRYRFTRDTMNPLSERRTFSAVSDDGEEGETWIDTGYLSRIHLMTESFRTEKTIGRIVLDLKLKTNTDNDFIIIHLHDPGNPHRIWTHAELKLRDFHEGGRLRLILDSPPMIMAEGDLVWLDVLTYDGAKMAVGGADGSKMVLCGAPRESSVEAYEKKALMPALAEFTKAYHHRPWIFEDIWPDIDNPHSLGGQFDSIVPAIAVARVLPESRLAKFYIEWGGPKYYWGSFTDPEKNFPIKPIAVPDGVPRWAHLQHIVQKFRWRVTDYLVANQNPDGQLWGGWNDDTLILRGRPDIPLDGNVQARDLFLKVYEGLDRTNIFGDGYCQIRPIDNVHNGDFVRERYRALLFALGDPYVYRRSLWTAWRWDKPDKTPFNWGDGKPFLFDKNMLDWYWGNNVPRKAYRTPDGSVVDENLSRIASYCDDILFHRFTAARVHTDASNIYNEHWVTRMLLGGGADNTISVSWPRGGGVDLARWVTYADSTSLSCRIFLHDGEARDVRLRLYRIQHGDYDIVVREFNPDGDGSVFHKDDARLSRFDTVTVPVPPKKEVVLEISQRKRRKYPETLPDLAVGAIDCDRRKNIISIRVSNFGDAPSKKTIVRLVDDRGDTVGSVKVPAIEAASDYMNKSTWVDITNIPRTGVLMVVVDPKDKQREITEENNRAIIPEP